VSDYARPMPYLGFDPAPGDVGLTRAMARQYAAVAQELGSVVSAVRGVDTSGWTGAAADALRTSLGTLPPALSQAIATARELESAASSWAGQLAGFQSEADALEKKAQAAATAPKPKAPPGGHAPQPPGGPAPSPLDAIQAQARELNGRYLAAAGKTASGVSEDPGLWEKSEPLRDVLEFVLAPLDMVAADHWIDWLQKAAGVPAGWLKDVDSQLETIQSLQAEGKSATQMIEDTASLIERVGGKLDAWDAFAPAWLKSADGSLTEIRGLSYTLSGLGLASDAGTIISPEDTGAMGWADRGAAGINGALIVANMTTDEIPVVGEVTMLGTGTYLAGDFLYHHFKPFHDFADGVGHDTVKAVDWVGSLL